MKKKVLFVVAAAMLVFSASATIMAIQGWQVVNDQGCNKCVITDNTRKCGKCGSFMKNGKLEQSDNYTWEATFTCTNANCGHTVRGGSK